ncbi:MAG: CdaR family protein [Bacteroidota bacterium]
MNKGKILPKIPVNFRKSYEKKLRQRLTVFAVCFLIALFLWLVIKLSNAYVSEVEYSVKYQNNTSDKILAEASDSTIHIKVKSSGFKLLDLKWFSSLQKINIGIDHTIMTPYYSEGQYNYYILPDNSVSKIERQLEEITKIEDVRPDTIYLWMDEKSSRKVVVNPNLNIDYKSQYQPYNDIFFEPDSIRVSGPSGIIDTLSEIKTEPFIAEDVDDDISDKLKLDLPDKIEARQKTISLNIDVEEFTETSLEVPVDVNIEEGSSRSIKTFPNEVEITFWVALKDYQKISSGQFAATVDLKKVDTFASDDKVKVSVSRFPSYVKNLRVSPRYVEYIIQNNEQ